MTSTHITTACAQVETLVVRHWGRQSLAVLAFVIGRLCRRYSVAPGDVTEVITMAYHGSEAQ